MSEKEVIVESALKDLGWPMCQQGNDRAIIGSFVQNRGHRIKYLRKLDS
jgi:hypothetical protein